jgi:hypothetical protein
MGIMAQSEFQPHPVWEELWGLVKRLIGTMGRGSLSRAVGKTAIPVATLHRKFKEERYLLSYAEAAKLLTLAPSLGQKELLRRALIRRYLGPEAEVPVDLQADWLWALMLDAVRLPKVHLSEYTIELYTPCALLVGMGLSLIQFAEIVERNRGFESVKLLHHELLNSLEQMRHTGRALWAFDPYVSIWAMGFFLNKAQVNLVDALTLCIDHFLMKEYPVTHEIFNTPFENRLTALADDIPKNKISAMMSAELIEALNACSTAAAAVDQINAVAALCQPSQFPYVSLTELEHIYTALHIEEQIALSPELPGSQTEWTAIAIRRGTTMEHRRDKDGKHAPPRENFAYAIEWMATLRAMEWTGVFWRAVFEDK